MKYLKRAFPFSFLLILAIAAWAQTSSRQGISFTLVDKAGAAITDDALASGQLKVYSLRDAQVAQDQQLSFNPANKRFTFSEAVLSSGISLALVSPTDTMFLSVYGRSVPERFIEGVQIQKGSYVLTSNEFSGKYLKVEDWSLYLEDEVAADKQDLSSYLHQLKDKKPVTLVQGTARK